NAERVNLAQLSFSQNTQNSMKEIQTRRIPGARLENSSLQYYLRKNKLYDNLAIEWADRKDIGYCVGVSDKLPHWIVYIMNQYIGGINLQEQISLLDTFYAQPIKYSLGELLYIYWKVLLYTSVSIILLATVVLLRYKHKITSAKVVQLEQYDELTGAYNRVHFCKLLEKFIENQRHYSVVAFNIRNFKYINDTYGSQQGDKLLCEIKKVLDNNIEKDEFIGRPSSDIFYLALLDDKTEAIKCHFQSIFQQLRERTEKLLDGYQISFYAGAVSNCTFPVANTAQTNLNCVMIALTHAKKNNDDTDL
ncbi:MAG: GGDEF domain-containing protein, partial [Candidatus Treponema excrementipullorum]|nr:GGDEF domain-containing protein [Candidatus Treponema excrementipullorum]